MSMKFAPTLAADAERGAACVLFPGALGDFICFLPALSALAERGPVDLFARSEYADLVAPAVKVRSAERYEIRRLFVAQSAREERLIEFFAPYASVYSWMGSQQSVFVEQLQRLSAGRAHLFPFHPRDCDTHQAAYYSACVGQRPAAPVIPSISPRAEGLAWRETFWLKSSLAGKPVLVLAPGSGGREKNWPVEYFCEVAEWWRRRTRGVVVVLVGPAEEERGGLELLFKGALVTRNLTLGQAAALLAGSDLCLGNDSGITHLAAALGVRTVALFGPSDPRRWAPLGPKVTVLSRNAACSPCASAAMKTCPYRACLLKLEPRAVIDAMERLPEAATLTRGGAGIRVSMSVPAEFPEAVLV